MYVNVRMRLRQHRSRLGCKWSLVQIQSPRHFEAPDLSRCSRDGQGPHLLGSSRPRALPLSAGGGALQVPAMGGAAATFVVLDDAGTAERSTEDRGDVKVEVAARAVGLGEEP